MIKFFGRRNSIPSGATFTITQVGRKKVQEFSGDARSKILMVLEMHGTCDVDEISKYSGINRGAVERLIPKLTRGGYIQYIKAGEIEAE